MCVAVWDGGVGAVEDRLAAECVVGVGYGEAEMRRRGGREATMGIAGCIRWRGGGGGGTRVPRDRLARGTSQVGTRSEGDDDEVEERVKGGFWIQQKRGVERARRRHCKGGFCEWRVDVDVN